MPNPPEEPKVTTVQDEIKETFGLSPEQGIMAPDDEEVVPEVEEEAPEQDPVEETPTEDEPVTLTLEIFEQKWAEREAALEEKFGVREPVTPTEPVVPPTSKLPDLQITEEELDSAFESPTNLLGLLQKVRNQAVEDAMSLLPDLAAKQVREEQSTAAIVTTFFADNEDLNDLKQYVGTKANILAEKNPSWGMAKLLEEAGKEVRKDLGAYRKAQKIDKDADDAEEKKLPTKAPGTDSNARQRSGGQKLSDRQKEIAETFGINQ